LLDTSVLIALERLNPADLPDVGFISAVTLAELSVGPLVAADPQEQAVRQARLQYVESNFDPLPFDAACARAYAQVAADLRAAGRKSSARAYNAMIAGTALAHGLPLFTLNAADFRSITRLAVHELTE
jgi:predicted nucleic acid-binding protein